jgi:hypothetical protein
MKNQPWQITLGGTGRVYSQEEWTALDKDQRRTLLVQHKGTRFNYI